MSLLCCDLQPLAKEDMDYNVDVTLMSGHGLAVRDRTGQLQNGSEMDLKFRPKIFSHTGRL